MVEIWECSVGEPGSLAMAATHGLKPLLTIRTGHYLNEKLRDNPQQFVFTGDMQWFAGKVGRYGPVGLAFRPHDGSGLLGSHRLLLARAPLTNEPQFVVEEGAAGEGFGLYHVTTIDDPQVPTSAAEFDRRLQARSLLVDWPEKTVNEADHVDFGGKLRDALLGLAANVWKTSPTPAIATFLASSSKWLPFAVDSARVSLHANGDPSFIQLEFPPQDTARCQLFALLADNPAEWHQIVDQIMNELRAEAPMPWFRVACHSCDKSRPRRSGSSPVPRDGAWQAIDALRKVLRDAGCVELGDEIDRRILRPTHGDPPLHAQATERLAMEVCLMAAHDLSFASNLIQFVRLIVGHEERPPIQAEPAGIGYRYFYDMAREDPQDLKWMLPLGTRLEPKPHDITQRPRKVHAVVDGVRRLDIRRSLLIEVDAAGAPRLLVRQVSGITTSGLILKIGERGQRIKLPEATHVDVTLSHTDAGCRVQVAAQDLSAPLPGGADDELFLGRYRVNVRERSISLVWRPRVTHFAALEPLDLLIDWFSPLTKAIAEHAEHIRLTPPSYDSYAAYCAVADLANKWPNQKIDELLARIVTLGERIQGRLAPALTSRAIPIDVPGERYPEFLKNKLQAACAVNLARPLRRDEQYRVEHDDGVVRIAFEPGVKIWAERCTARILLRFDQKVAPPSILLLKPRETQILPREDKVTFDLNLFATPIVMSRFVPGGNFEVLFESRMNSAINP